MGSLTSFTELRREAMAIERYNRMHPQAKPKVCYIEQCLKPKAGPVIAATDYMKLYADQIRGFVPQRYITLGTDGFGLSDTRKQLRHHFEVDAKYIVLAALQGLVDDGKFDNSVLKDAMKRYRIDPEKIDPATRVDYL